MESSAERSKMGAANQPAGKVREFCRGLLLEHSAW